VADVALRLRELTAPYDVIVELRDPDEGLFVEAFMPPPENVREARRKPARGHGGNRLGVKLDDEGTAQVILRVEGASWGEVQTRWGAVRAGLRAFPDFYLEEVVDGVTTRWVAERGNVTPSEHVGEAIASAFIVQDLRFTCQPFPSVEIV
jgi:hypothetical protein